MSHFHRKPKYQVNLIRFQAVCETNYQRLMKLLPALSESSFEKQSQESTFYFPALFHLDQQSPAWLRVNIVNRSPYTTLLELDMSLSWITSVTPPTAEVRLYHDVMMAEVVYQKSSQRVESRYEYPNPSMHQPNEKEQHNFFLAQWLDYVIAGQSINMESTQPSV
ncbi:DUF1249 domain-containing protein [Endozoicomonas ascidiicola]|uniref:DUF1249 domain-containing protein n=1 Tax=Endozoicomonas ascidiicola TaxID=1698521 RepID=UPI00082B8355|nr:DUF1249 domain-containing protein [Endozoicomonas ascidiicola]